MFPYFKAADLNADVSRIELYLMLGEIRCMQTCCLIQAAGLSDLLWRVHRTFPPLVDAGMVPPPFQLQFGCYSSAKAHFPLQFWSCSKQSCGDLTPPRSYQYLFDIISCTKFTLEVEGSLLGFMQPWLLSCEAINLIRNLVHEDPVCRCSLAPWEQWSHWKWRERPLQTRLLRCSARSGKPVLSHNLCTNQPQISASFVK